MKEYFISANSFAAPFVSDDSTKFMKADSPQAALEKFAAEYSHPCGLFAAACWESADAYHKGEKALARWESNRVIKQREITDPLGSYSICGHGPDKFEVDGKMYHVDNPLEGRVV